MRTLVCEPDDVGRNILARHLQRFGVCDTATDGTVALAATRSARASGEPYELVLLDVAMPEMDGLTLLRQLRLDEALPEGVGIRAKVVMTTSRTDMVALRAASQNGADGYLVKPLRTAEIERILQDLGYLRA